MTFSNDLERMRQVYAERERLAINSRKYSPFEPANLFIMQQRQRAVLRTLKHHNYSDLADCNILEMGCGSGTVLLEFLSYGADPARLHGVDYLFERLMAASEKLPKSPLICANGEYLPYPDASFDLVLQFTAFSSILDQMVRAHTAGELLRLLRPNGLILWYDFWLNPLNMQTHGIRPQEVRRLFPNCNYHFERITLAPPLARRVVRFSWSLGMLLESVKIFNSHYLAVICPNTES